MYMKTAPNECDNIIEVFMIESLSSISGDRYPRGGHDVVDDASNAIPRDLPREEFGPLMDTKVSQYM